MSTKEQRDSFLKYPTMQAAAMEKSIVHEGAEENHDTVNELPSSANKKVAT